MVACFGRFLILAILLSGCSYSIQKTVQPEVPPSSQYKTSELTYGSVYTRVFRASCVGCHGTSGNVNLESYAAARSHLTKIYQSTILERKMPKAPTAPLTADQLGLLNAWIQAGAPESSPGEEPPPPLEPTFESIRTHILEPKCLMCHAPGKPVARIPLVTRENLLNSPLDIVVPGNAEESGIILAVTSERPDKLMPPPKDENGQPTGFSKLSNEEIRILSEWINRGAQD